MAKYVFPLVNWQGIINPHGGTEKGGSDIFAPLGTPIVSIADGTVISVGNDGPGGNNVEVKDSNGLIYYFAHLRDTPLVKVGQKVTAGQPIGFVGQTGNAAGTPPHLHLGIGYSIINGTGATGGTGVGFDAVTFLRAILAGTAIGTIGAYGNASGGLATISKALGADTQQRIVAVLIGGALLVGGVSYVFVASGGVQKVAKVAKVAAL